MGKARNTTSFISELAEFLASRPTREQLLVYRPSQHWQRRASNLLQKQNEGTISPEERQELEEFAHAERLIRLIKSRLHASQGAKS
jgi:hypothetical protein